MTRDRRPVDHRGKQRCPRNAHTLIELMGTLSVLLVLGVSAASLLGSVTEIGKRANQARQVRVSVQRLASVFRDDVQRADSVNLSAKSSIELTVGDEAIQYAWNDPPHVISRRVSVANEPVAIDRFILPQACRPQCAGDVGIVSLRLSSKEQLVSWIIEVTRP